MKFTASRLSDGNKVFPAEIYTEDSGIKVKIPGFFRGDTKFINYENISMEINTPLIGYSTLTFFYQGSKAHAHGFTKDQAKQIKAIIDNGKKKSKITTVNHVHQYEDVEDQPKHKKHKHHQTSEEPTDNDDFYEKETTVAESARPTYIDYPKESNNSGLYSSQLEKLIDFALADGVLSEKEREVLLKKAREEGIDQDEFEMVVDARLFEKQSNMPQKPKEQPKPMDFSIPGIDSPVSKLFKMLNEIEATRSNDSNNPLQSAFNSLLTKSLGFNPDKVTNQKKELISSFPIPNDKKDMLEFLSMALPKAKMVGTFFTSGSFNTPTNQRNKLHNEFVPIWREKCHQIILHARFLLKDDPDTLNQINAYAMELNIV
jgi:hypothetical protein